MKVSQRDLIIAALEARGYQRCKYDPMLDVWLCYSISPQALRRVHPGGKVWFGDGSAIRVGRLLGTANPMPTAMRRNLAEEGRILYSRIVTSLEDLGL